MEESFDETLRGHYDIKETLLTSARRLEMESMRQKVEQIVLRGVETILKNDEPLNIQMKGKQDVVTQKDIQMERYLVEALSTLFPEDHFIGEEEHLNQISNQRTWVIDPIDGTLNYAKGLPLYGVQLALMINQEPVFCVIVLPEINQVYSAQAGEGAFLNGQPIKLDSSSHLEDIIVTFGDFSKSNPSSRPFQLYAISQLMTRAMKVRIQGASSVDFAFASSGKNGAHIMFSKRLWEIAPGLMFAKEAGCAIGKISGNFEGEGIVIAQNDMILNEILSCLEDKNDGEIN